MYLVDGNNLMGRRVGWHRDKRAARRRLLDDLARFAQAASVRLSVVFDGAPEEHFPDGSSYRGVRVFYAERGSNADERIKRMVDAARERRTLSVVTSDRALAGYVRASGVGVIRAGEFQKRMDEASAASAGRATESRDEPPGMTEEELLREMRYFGVAPEDED